MKKRLFSLLLTLCMVLSLLPAMGITASAATDDSWVGSESFDSTADHTGTGFTWAASTKTLTLSGVNVTAESEKDGIHIAGAATVVLEGANKVTAVADNSGLYCSGAMTIKGSGTLEVIGSGSNGIYASNLIVESGFLSFSGVNNGINSTTCTVNGGYIVTTASSTKNYDGAICATDYRQSGGMVIARGGANGVSANGFTLTGGYLESSGSNGIGCSDLSNSGGVIKATGTANGLHVTRLTCTGGVSIAEGGTAAVTATTVSGNELYWVPEASVVSGAGESLNDETTPVMSDTHKSVVIAKEIAAPAAADGIITLDGHYLYSASGTALTATDNLTVTGGSYVETASVSKASLSCEEPLTVGDGTNHATLVAVGSCLPIQTVECGLTVAANASLVAVNKGANSFGISSDTGITSAGNTIAVAGDAPIGIRATGHITVTGGYMLGIGDTQSGIMCDKAINASGNAAVTAISSSRAASTYAGLSASSGTISGAAQITAINNADGLAYCSSSALTGSSAYCAAAKYGALAEATYSSDDHTYKVGTTPAKVVCIKAAQPTFDLRNGTTVNVKPTTPSWKDYTFAGWYTDIDGTGTLLDGEPVGGTTYYAKWTIEGGKTVRTSPLNLNEAEGDDANEAEGWAWYAAASENYDSTAPITSTNHPNNTLILTDATIDCSGVTVPDKTDYNYAIQLPGATIQLEGSSTVKAGNGGRNNYGIVGLRTILGSGTLSAASGSATYRSSGIHGDGVQLTIGNASESPTVIATGGNSEVESYGLFSSPGVTVQNGSVTATGGTAPRSYGIGEPLTVNGGTVTAVAGEGSLTTSAVQSGLTTTGFVMAGDTPETAASCEGGMPANVKYVNIFFTKAELSGVGTDGAISGTVGTALTGQTATVTLTGTTFKAVNMNTEWDTNLPGVKAKVTPAITEGAITAAITFSGTPTAPSDDALTITIPATALASGPQLTTTENLATAKWYVSSYSQKRESPADFGAIIISYKNPYGNEKSAGLIGNITDSGEGWAWYATQSEGYAPANPITAENHPAKTLVLNGVNIVTDAALALHLPADATIVLKTGTTNTVKSTYTGGDSYTAGVTCAGVLTIEGSGTLNATGGTATDGATDYDSMGVHGSTGLTINGGVVNGYGGASAQNSAGISADTGVLTINSGTVTGQGGTSSYNEASGAPGGSVGLYADGNIAVNGGSVTGNGGDAETAESIGISCGGTVAIAGGSVTGTGTTAAFVARSGIEFPTTFAINTPSNGVLVVGEGATTVFANEADEHPATNVTIAVKPSSGGGAAPATTVPVIVDGEEYNIGTAETSGGVTTVTVDQTALQKQLDSASENVVIPVTPGGNADTVTVKLLVANVDEMAAKEMTLSVQVDNVSYDMPAVAVDTKTLMKELGASDPVKVPVNVTIRELDEDDVDLSEGELVLPPVSFTVTASFGGKNAEVEEFEKYVQRVIKVPGGDAGEITTAVVVENGKQRHVPTEVFQKDGKWYARINSLTNSVYALIHNEKSFTDAGGKWYEAVVTEMASRGVIDGRGEGMFDGEASITRAEFAAILVRALGLPENGDASRFTDIAPNAWCTGGIGTAYAHGIVDGRSGNTFDPNANITRQEAMQMIYNASEIAPIKLLSGINPGQYKDLNKVSDWAEDAARFALLNGIVKGDGGLIRPLDNISRAESATIILRLLQKAELVDVRTEA